MQGILRGPCMVRSATSDGDGYIDLMVVDLEYGALYRNLGNGLFADITAASGLKQAFTGKGAWGAALFDYDNDGDLDVYSANGMADWLGGTEPVVAENAGQGQFHDVGPQRGDYFREKRSARRGGVGLRQRRRPGHHRFAR